MIIDCAFCFEVMEAALDPGAATVCPTCGAEHKHPTQSTDFVLARLANEWLSGEINAKHHPLALVSRLLNVKGLDEELRDAALAAFDLASEAQRRADALAEGLRLADLPGNGRPSLN